MPPKTFSVHVDPDALAKHDLATGLARSAVSFPAGELPARNPAGEPPARNQAGELPGQASGVDAAHHGARAGRQPAPGRAGRDHTRTGGAKSRSYAFRRS